MLPVPGPKSDLRRITNSRRIRKGGREAERSDVPSARPLHLVSACSTGRSWALGTRRPGGWTVVTAGSKAVSFEAVRAEDGRLRLSQQQ